MKPAPTNNHCQYGEEPIILDFFKGKLRGFVVDVGAADGVQYSNSRFLIRDCDWYGILIEPEPKQFRHLEELYHDDPGVRTIWAAASLVEGVGDLHPFEMGSTLVPAWKERIERTIKKAKYGEPVKVRTCPLWRLLNEVCCPKHIDFLTVDCEGMDIEVLKSMDWLRYDVKLVCVESGDNGELADPLNHYMKGIGYQYHAHTHGNTFWKR